MTAERENKPGTPCEAPPVDTNSTPARPFLTAEWHYLVMLNYEVDPGLIRRFVPPGVSLDSVAGTTLVSLVGFRFLSTRVRGIPIPGHRDFDEVNLRLYVRREGANWVKRGVVFIREIVPKRAIAMVARFVYNEPYVCPPMRHSIRRKPDLSRQGTVNEKCAIEAEYGWRLNGAWNRLYARASGDPLFLSEGSLAQFITEHYWGYTAGRRGGCGEYEVAHPPWRVWSATEAAGFEGDATSLYGRDLASVLRREPHSTFLAEGSPVTVFAGRKIA